MRSGHYRNLKTIVESGLFEINTTTGEVFGKNGNRIGSIDNKNGIRNITFHCFNDKFTYREHDVMGVKQGYDLTKGRMKHITSEHTDNSKKNLRFEYFKVYRDEIERKEYKKYAMENE